MASTLPPIWLVLALAAFSAAGASPITAGLRSYAKAREVLDAGVRAMGGLDALQSLESVRRTIARDRVDTGQGLRPFPAKIPAGTVLPALERYQLLSFMDYGRNRWLESLREINTSEDYATVTDVVGEERGFETIAFHEEKPFFRAFPPSDLPTLRARKFQRFAEGLLRAALDRPETLEWVGAEHDLGNGRTNGLQGYRVISWADSAGTRLLLYFDAETHLLGKAETLRDHPVAGDTVTEILFDDYRQVGRLKLPFHSVSRVAGVPTDDLHVTAIEPDVALPEERFRAPGDVVVMEDDPPQPRVEKLGPELYLIRGTYNSIFAVFKDGVVVFEAGGSSRYAESCLDLIRATAPGIPISRLVATHFHFDHIAGVRTFIAEGVPVVTTPDAKAVIERAAASRHTIRPDALSRKPRPPVIETVADKKVLDDGVHRVELYNFGPTPHAAEILVAYFPGEKLLFEPDLFDIVSNELMVAGEDGVVMARKIRELNLSVDRIVPVHGIPGSIQTLERALAVRAKYIK
jgi:glyoxylase-like metal-dependent hydrolase (beta-lactamase superfamily II)